MILEMRRQGSHIFPPGDYPNFVTSRHCHHGLVSDRGFRAQGGIAGIGRKEHLHLGILSAMLATILVASSLFGSLAPTDIMRSA